MGLLSTIGIDIVVYSQNIVITIISITNMANRIFDKTKTPALYLFCALSHCLVYYNTIISLLVLSFLYMSLKIKYYMSISALLCLEMIIMIHIR